VRRSGELCRPSLKAIGMAAFGTGLTLAEFLLQESEADLVTVKLSGSAAPVRTFPEVSPTSTEQTSTWR
jgi:hypothetical protein